MDFKSFKKNKGNDKTLDGKEDLRDTAQKYAGKSEEEVLSEILRLAGENRRNGTLTESEIKDFERKVLPMLNEEQKARLERVLKMLRG